MQKLPAGTLVVVADGQKARLFRSIGDDRDLTLQQQDILSAEEIPLQGPSGVAPPQQTPQRNDERTFAKHVAQALNDGALNHDYAQLVLVADPKTLGEIRPQLHKETQDRLLCEIAKTLTNAPVEDIQRALH